MAPGCPNLQGPRRPDPLAMIRCIEPLLSSSALPCWWQPLFEASGSDSVFLSSAWMQAWIDIYGADFEGVWVYWEDGGQVVAGCLLIERVIWVRNIPFRSQFLNATGQAAKPTPFAEFNDVLHLPGHAERVATDLAALMRSRSWSRVLLEGHERQGIAARLLERFAGLHTEQEGKAARYVDLAALDERPFEAFLTGKTATRVRRNRRAFQERLGEITVGPAADLPETLAFFGQMRALHVARWNGRDKATTLACDAVVEFHRRIIEALFDQGRVEMIRVSAGGRPIGYLYNFVMRGKVSVFQTGFAYEAGSTWSPGLLTHSVAIEHYRQRGMREYDLLAGEALYKRALCNAARELLWTTVYRDQPWIRLVLAARRLRNRLRSRSPALVMA